MPPKKGKKQKTCLRCPSDADDAVKCNHTLRCRSDTGDYADLANLWPGFPSDPKSSFDSLLRVDCERLLDAAAKGPVFLYEDITKQMLEQALKRLQTDMKGPKAPKHAQTASDSRSATATPIAGPSRTAAPETAPEPQPELEPEPAPEPERESGSPRIPPEGPVLTSLQQLAIRERADPFAKLMHSSKLGRSVTTPLVRPQMRLELDMPQRQGLPRATHEDVGEPQDCREAWAKKMPQIEEQRDAAQHSTETFTLRPGFANTSSQVMIRSNHFVVKLDPKKELFEYEILGIPDSASKGKKRDLIETFMLNCPALRDQPDEYATDFRKKVIAWKDLFVWHAKEDPEESRTLIIPGRADSKGQSTDTVFRLNFVRKLSVQELNDYVQGRQISFANTGVIEALNILISKGVSEANAQSIEVGTNRFYYKPGHIALADGLIAIRGYFASIRPGMGNVLLNVNTVMGAFYDPTRLDLVISRFQATIRNTTQADTPATNRAITQATKFLKGVRVRVMYNRARSADIKGKMSAVKDLKAQSDTDGESIDSERRRTKSIWSIGLAGNQQTFDKGGKRVGVVNYLKETYPQLHITRPDLFCVNLGNDAQPSWFLPEHLHILPYQLYKSKLDANQVAEMIKHACRDPDTNRMLIMEEGLPSIGITTTLPRVLAQTNMQISRNMVDVPAFAMKMPTILCQRKPDPRRPPPRSRPGPPGPQELNKLQISNNAPFGYHWEMTRNKPMKTEKKYNSTTYLISIDSGKGKSPLEQIVGEFNREIPSYGFGSVQLTDKNWTQLSPTQAGQQGIKSGLEAAAKIKADLVVLLLPTSSSSQAANYRYFKSQADQVYGFKTICMAVDKLEKGGLKKAMHSGQFNGCLRYYMSGVALKLNLKLGNWNWETGGDQGEIRNYIWNIEGGRLNTLVLGADVTHPGPGSVEGCPSVAAVVGNVDLVCGRMPGSMRYQAGRVEMIEKLDEMVEERLRDWNAETRRKRTYGQYDLPMRIIYYRDGVSESQYSAVKALEIPQIKAAWQRARTRALAQGSTGLIVPKDLEVTCVLVSKRHNTRFYPSPQNHPLRDTDTPRPKGKGNLKPGVVVESVVTSPYWHDFYLNSHFGLQGTVRPCHYIVIEDDHKTSAVDIQRLTFLLCHMYQRAMCSVSYATPTYYADRLCERGRHYLAEFFDGDKDSHVKNQSAEVMKKRLEDCWHRGDRNRDRANPWHPNLDGTMFWL